jgi:hypothetical protein
MTQGAAMTMSKDEYVSRYAISQNLPVEEVLRHLAPVPCDCDRIDCLGWNMTNVGEAVILDITKSREYILCLRRVLKSRAPNGASLSMVDRAVLGDLLGHLEMQAAPHEGVTSKPIEEGLK